MDMVELEAHCSRLAGLLGDTLTASRAGFARAVWIGHAYVYKTSASAQVKAAHVGDIIHAAGTEISALVPSVVVIEAVSSSEVVYVETRLQGTHPSQLDASLATELGTFLKGLHSVPVVPGVNEFEGSRSPTPFVDWMRDSMRKYVARLATMPLDEGDRTLLTDAEKRVSEILDHINIQALVLLHKDIHLENLLTSPTGALTGVVDWDAAMVGPPEWEFAIIQQRFPDVWSTAAAAYAAPLDPDLVRACGLVQAARFWKSFPSQADFVAQQRQFIASLL